MIAVTRGLREASRLQEVQGEEEEGRRRKRGEEEGGGEAWRRRGIYSKI